MRQADRAARVVVVGGGITGAFSAFFLARGGVQVTLLERDAVGAHASGNNPGGLNPRYGPGIPGPLETFALESHRLHQEFWDELELAAPGGIGTRHKHRLNLAVDRDDVDRLSVMKEHYDAVDGFSARWVEPEELRTIEPRLDPEIVRGLDAEGDARVDAAAYTTAVFDAARREGAASAVGEAIDLVRNGNRVVAVLTRHETVDCDAVVVATGPWCAEPAEWLGVPLPMEPVKGEMVLVEPSGGGVTVDLAWRDVAAYRTGDATIWLGGSEDHTGFDEGVTESARDFIVGRLARVLPAIRDAFVLRQTAGLRPLTPDGLPIVGMAPGWENVALALGGGRKGMLFASAMGRAVADLVSTGTTDLPIDACAPDRFAT